MKKTAYLILPLLAALFMTASCDSDDTTVAEQYKDWREFNENWMAEQNALTEQDGTPYYRTVVGPADPQAFVLYHPVGEVNTGNLTPLYTSTVKANYTLRLANDSVMDKGTGFVTQLNSSGLINGWSIALMQMHVGDSATVLIPYAQGYGESGNGSSIPPYSNLRFDIRLVDIVAYQIRP